MTGEEKKAILEEARSHIMEVESLRRLIETTTSWAESTTYQMKEIQAFGGPRVNRVSEGAIRLVDLSNKMSQAMCGIAEEIDRAYSVIEEVPESIDRVILMEYYLNGLTWEQVGDRVGYVRKTCMEHRDLALGLENKDVTQCYSEM